MKLYALNIVNFVSENPYIHYRLDRMWVHGESNYEGFFGENYKYCYTFYTLKCTASGVCAILFEVKGTTKLNLNKIVSAA